MSSTLSNSSSTISLLSVFKHQPLPRLRLSASTTSSTIGSTLPDTEIRQFRTTLNSSNLARLNLDLSEHSLGPLTVQPHCQYPLDRYLKEIDPYEAFTVQIAIDRQDQVQKALAGFVEAFYESGRPRLSSPSPESIVSNPSLGSSGLRGAERSSSRNRAITSELAAAESSGQSGQQNVEASSGSSQNDAIWREGIILSDSENSVIAEGVEHRGEWTQSAAYSASEDSLDIVDPLKWVALMKGVEVAVMERSYLWFQYEGELREKQKNSYLKPIELMSKGMFYASTSLPQQAPARFLAAMWHTLQNAEQTFEENRETMETQLFQEIENHRASRNILLTLCATFEWLRDNGLFQAGITIFVESLPDTADVITLDDTALMKVLYYVNSRIHVLSQRSEPLKMDAILSLWGVHPSRLTKFLFVDAFRKGYSYVTEVGTPWKHVIELLDAAVVAQCGAHIVSSPNHFSALHQLGVPIASSSFSPFLPMVFRPRSLSCLDTFLSGRQVWILQRFEVDFKKAVSIRTTIEALSNIWGPIWRLYQPNSQDRAHLYAMGKGFIGVALNWGHDHLLYKRSGDVACHFAPSRSAAETLLQPITAVSDQHLLIGRGLDVREACPTPSMDYFRQVKIKPFGTFAAKRLPGPTTLTIALSYFGMQVGYQRQYLNRDCSNRKQRLLDRWRPSENYEPQITHLLLYCGVEGSLCTRNARRVRLIDVIKSPALSWHRSRLNWNDSKCGEEFRQAIEESGSTRFIEFYESAEPAWKAEIRAAIWRLLQLLSDTGLQDDGDAGFYYYDDSGDDPEIAVILKSRHHTWVKMLVDDGFRATFAVATPLCLAFRYKSLPGQGCRHRRKVSSEYSVLETKIVAQKPDQTLAPIDWARQLSERKYLPLSGWQVQGLKFIRHLRRDEMIVRLSNRDFVTAAEVKIPGGPASFEFLEVVDAKRATVEHFMTVYVKSDAENDLPEPTETSSSTGGRVEAQEAFPKAPASGQRKRAANCVDKSAPRNALSVEEINEIPLRACN